MPSTAVAPGLRGGPHDSLLWVDRLEKTFMQNGRRRLSGGAGALTAVDGVSFDVRQGETFGLVGESGCGKSTIARCLLRLLDFDAGKVYVDGTDIGALSDRTMRKQRRQMQIVFQDPYSSLDPRMSVRAAVEEPLTIHRMGTKEERLTRADEMLELVGITPAQRPRKPHAFSGGQRQRIAIARALVLNPSLVILDEPVSALDVSIQAQVINLLKRLQTSLGLTYVFIAHDLTLAEYFCDRVAVLYLGKVMEMARSEALFQRPLHPYTQALLSAVPIPDPEVSPRRERIVLTAEVTNESRARGCRFRPRCPVGRMRELCTVEEPPLAEHGTGHWAACHFPGELEFALLPGTDGRPEGAE
jgi:oligopeptide/dipeptide ABC transporter ATP-binding protein